MSKEPILVTPQQDLCAAVANAAKNSEIVLAPGRYVLSRPLVVDKTVFIRSQTGNADDATIERDNATVLVVTNGKPTFQGIEFRAPAASDDAPMNTNEYDVVEYESAVAARNKGNATFIECRASSRQKSAFSARDKKAFITLDKCRISQTGEGGLFVDGNAGALVKNSLIQNTRLGCVDVESRGSKITVENSSLENSGYAALSPHHDGLLIVRKCKIDVAKTFGAFVIDNGRLEVENSVFLSNFRENDPDVDLRSQFGVLVRDGIAKLTDCHMTRLCIGVFMATPDAKLEMKRVKMDEGMLASLVYDENSPKVKVSGCQLGEPSIEREAFVMLFQRAAQEVGVAEWNSENYTTEQKDRAFNLKTQYYEKILGKQFTLCIEPEGSLSEGGRLGVYYYRKSRYGGVFLLTKQLASPEFFRPVCDGFDSYELAIASREPFFFDDFGRELPNYEELALTYANLYGYLTQAAQYVWNNVSVAPYHTLELADEKNPLYFVFDALDKPEIIEVEASARDALDDYAMQSESTQKSQEALSLDEALQMYSDSESDMSEKRNESVKHTFGVLVMIALHKSEIEYIRAHAGSAKILLQKLKEQNRWPFSDLTRPPIF